MTVLFVAVVAAVVCVSAGIAARLVRARARRRLNRRPGYITRTGR